MRKFDAATAKSRSARSRSYRAPRDHSQEFHLSTGDPKLMGLDKVEIIGNTNSILPTSCPTWHGGIHARRQGNGIVDIRFRVKNALSRHPGRSSAAIYVSPFRGWNDLRTERQIALEVFDSDMVGEPAYISGCRQHLPSSGSTISPKHQREHHRALRPEKAKTAGHCIDSIRKVFPTRICVPQCGSVDHRHHMKIPGSRRAARTCLTRDQRPCHRPDLRQSISVHDRPG